MIVLTVSISHWPLNHPPAFLISCSTPWIHFPCLTMLPTSLLAYLPQFLLLSVPLWSLLISSSLQSFCFFYLTCKCAQKTSLSPCNSISGLFPRFLSGLTLKQNVFSLLPELLASLPALIRYEVTRFPWSMPWISEPFAHYSAQPHLLRLLPGPENLVPACPGKQYAWQPSGGKEQGVSEGQKKKSITQFSFFAMLCIY